MPNVTCLAHDGTAAAVDVALGEMSQAFDGLIVHLPDRQYRFARVRT